MRFTIRNLLTLAMFVLIAGAYTHAAAPEKGPGRPIDLVLCLDVSGSMNGLIDSAKLKLWDVVNELAKMKPTPDLRVSLYTYGHSTYDPATGWVRKEVDLTPDLDEVYKLLNALRTNGGEEYVARVTQTALTNQKWSTADKALKIIFVCGNEPVDQDKQVTLDSVAQTAKKQDVVINTIYCGPDENPEAAGWRAFAISCGGRYANIDQDRAKRQVAVATEFDKEILKLSSELNTTYLAYGTEREQRKANQMEQDKNAAHASPVAAVARGVSKAGSLYRNSSWDLVDRMKEQKDFDLAKLKPEELPDEMKNLKPEERAAYLKKKTEEREALQKRITELDAKRAKKVAEELAKQPKSTGEKSLDDALRATLREQAGSKGFEVPHEKK
jgi:hypothetical protein